MADAFQWAGKVSAAGRSCDYEDNNVAITVTVQGENVTYNFRDKNLNGGIVEDEGSFDVNKFETTCPDTIYYNMIQTSATGRKFVFSSDSGPLQLPLTTPISNDSFFGNLDVVKCGSIEVPAPIPPIIRLIVNFIKIATPLVLIIMGMIDMMQAVMSNDEKKLKDSQSKFPKRLLPGALVFLVVAIFQFLIGVIAPEDSVSVMNCIDCMINSADSCVTLENNR